jgi:hypothetical protein
MSDSTLYEAAIYYSCRGPWHRVANLGNQLDIRTQAQLRLSYPISLPLHSCLVCVESRFHAAPPVHVSLSVLNVQVFQTQSSRVQCLPMSSRRIGAVVLTDADRRPIASGFARSQKSTVLIGGHGDLSLSDGPYVPKDEVESTSRSSLQVQKVDTNDNHGCLLTVLTALQSMMQCMPCRCGRTT